MRFRTATPAQNRNMSQTSIEDDRRGGRRELERPREAQMHSSSNNRDRPERLRCARRREKPGIGIPPVRRESARAEPGAAATPEATPLSARIGPRAYPVGRDLRLEYARAEHVRAPGLGRVIARANAS